MISYENHTPSNTHAGNNSQRECPAPPRPPRYPSFEYIREKIPIIAVARELGIVMDKGYRAHCWRTESHSHGDADPSMSFQVKKNRGRCHLCDVHTWSTIDLVMLRLECDRRAAVNWIIERFPVPALPAGAHVKKREGWFPHYRAGANENVVTVLTKSGLLSDLTLAEQSVLNVLNTFTDTLSGYAEISYPGIMQYTGIDSRTTVARAIRRLEQMHILKVRRQPGKLLFRGVNQYILTIDDPQFDALLMKRFRSLREEIELEKQWRAEERKAKTQRKL